MRQYRIRIDVVVLCGLFALALAPVARAQVQEASEELVAAQQKATAAREAVDAADAALDEIRKKLENIAWQLEPLYRTLDVEMRNRDKKGEADTRAKIKPLKESRVELTASRERARMLLVQRQAELDAAEAQVRIQELLIAEEPDTKKIDDWKKKQEKAESTARKTAKLIEGLP